jgi:hypothetical protein
MSLTLGKSERVTPASPDGDLALHLTLGLFNETWAYQPGASNSPGRS